MGEIPMKIETRYISGRQADTKTVLFGKAMELPVCRGSFCQDRYG